MWEWHCQGPWKGRRFKSYPCCEQDMSRRPPEYRTVLLALRQWQCVWDWKVCQLGWRPAISWALTPVCPVSLNTYRRFRRTCCLRWQWLTCSFFYLFVFRRFNEILGYYRLRHYHVCLSVHPHGRTRLPLDGFSWDFIFEDFSKICWENSSFIKIWQR